MSKILVINIDIFQLVERLGDAVDSSCRSTTEQQSVINIVRILARHIIKLNSEMTCKKVCGYVFDESDCVIYALIQSEM